MNLIKTYDRVPLTFVKGKGSYLYDTNGQKYLDFMSGVAVNALGHSDPTLVQTIQKQAEKLIHVSNIFEIKEQTDLAKNLCSITGYNQVFFCNSGTEANEAALKFTRLHTKRKKFISFKNSFHGRTMGSLSVTGKNNIKQQFRPLLSNCKIIEFNNIKNLENSISHDIAGIIFEFVQGEGGINVIDPKFLEKIFQLAKKYKILTIADEVQTGMGRCGTFLAADQFKVKPDIITLAKGLGGGVPIGALITKNNIAKSITPGSHGSTFAGSPLITAIALSVIKVISKKEFLENVQKNAQYFYNQLEKIKKTYPKLILEIKGKGFLIGLKINTIKNRDKIIKILREKYQTLVLSAGSDVLRITPPLIITKKEIDLFIKNLGQVLLKF